MLCVSAVLCMKDVAIDNHHRCQSDRIWLIFGQGLELVTFQLDPQNNFSFFVKKYSSNISRNSPFDKNNNTLICASNRHAFGTIPVMLNSIVCLTFISIAKIDSISQTSSIQMLYFILNFVCLLDKIL
ncbi:MAG: hypothetical protein CM15mP32_1690 [Flavobacteriaceae bacterium]|nr:MAG: hypothetical protein CM15mP32_1690 [Flavobacteriaceae bacterium]